MSQSANRTTLTWAVYLSVWAVVGVAALIRGGQLARDSELPPLREHPLEVLPEYDYPVVVSDEQIRRVLLKLRPKFHGAKTKINHIDHALRFWTLAAKFEGSEYLSGPALRRLLLDQRKFAEVYGEQTPPLLMDRAEGVGVRVQEGVATSSHVDHTVACLAEAGTPLEFPMVSPQRQTTYRAMVEQTFRDFSLNQVEYEWSAMTFAMFLPPVTAWRTSEGQAISFDALARRMMRQKMPQGVCFGNHRLYSLVVFLRLDREHSILSDEVRQEIHAYLQDMTAALVSHQHPDGFWNDRWPDAAPETAAPSDREGDRLAERILATGHALEWWALAPESLHPPRHVLASAGQWLVREIDRMSDEDVEKWYTYLSHAGRALALWRGAFPPELLVRTAHLDPPPTRPQPPREDLTSEDPSSADPTRENPNNENPNNENPNNADPTSADPKDEDPTSEKAPGADRSGSDPPGAAPPAAAPSAAPSAARPPVESAARLE